MNVAAQETAHLLMLQFQKMTTGLSEAYNAVPESLPLAEEGTWQVMRGVRLIMRGY
jgi:hypothetical protein